MEAMVVLNSEHEMKFLITLMAGTLGPQRLFGAYLPSACTETHQMLSAFNVIFLTINPSYSIRLQTQFNLSWSRTKLDVRISLNISRHVSNIQKKPTTSRTIECPKNSRGATAENDGLHEKIMPSHTGESISSAQVQGNGTTFECFFALFLAQHLSNFCAPLMARHILPSKLPAPPLAFLRLMKNMIFV
jgi:hypothetical protein